MAESDRKASVELRKKAAPTKQKAIQKTVDLKSLQDSFAPSTTQKYLSTSVDQYGRYILTEIDPVTDQQIQVYIFVEPDGRFWDTYGGSDFIKKVKSSYKNQEVLRKELYDKGFISDNEYQSKSVNAFNGAILQAASEFSTEVADSFTTEGKIKFPAFDSWLTARGALSGEDRGPRRDINLIDRDVIKAIVRDIYMTETGNAPDEQFLNEKTDLQMEKIKKGTLTTAKKVNGETVIKTTPGFSESRLRAELPGQIKQERPTEIASKKSLDFLAFLSELGG